jgi:hypothetical protein
MKTIQVNAYSIDELKGKAKEKAIERIKDHMIEFNFEDFTFNTNDYIKHDLNIDGKVYYSLSYSQGDGLRIESPFFNSSNVIDMLKLDDSTKQAIKKLSVDGDLKVRTTSFWRNSFHAKSDVVVEFSEESEKLLPDHMMEKISDAFVDVYMDICDNLEKQGYACYDVEESDIIIYSNDNEYFYFENGDSFHG